MKSQWCLVAIVQLSNHNHQHKHQHNKHHLSKLWLENLANINSQTNQGFRKNNNNGPLGGGGGEGMQSSCYGDLLDLMVKIWQN
jgi:hypothetical protein